MALVTDKKWIPFDAVQEAKTNLKHRDIVGFLQNGNAGFEQQKRQS